MHKRFILGAGVCALLAAVSIRSGAEQTPAVNTATRTISYLHLYADDKGVSHIKEEKLTFQPLNAAAPDGALAIHQIAGAKGAVLLSLKAGAFEDWHTAPRRQFLVVVQGISEVTTSDGQVRRLAPGDIVLMDDTKGKGHQTRAVGKEDHIALMIAIEGN